MAPTRILFVCLGNICRSPTAEAVRRYRTGRCPAVGRLGLLVTLLGTI